MGSGDQERLLAVIQDICNGCENCQLICSFTRSEDSIFAKHKSLISMVRVDEDGYHEPIVACNGQPCNGQPKCVKYCPTGALIYGTAREISERKQELLALRKSRLEARVRAPWAMRRLP